MGIDPMGTYTAIISYTHGKWNPFVKNNTVEYRMDWDRYEYGDNHLGYTDYYSGESKIDYESLPKSVRKDMDYILQNIQFYSWGETAYGPVYKKNGKTVKEKDIDKRILQVLKKDYEENKTFYVNKDGFGVKSKKQERIMFGDYGPN